MTSRARPVAVAPLLLLAGNLMLAQTATLGGNVTSDSAGKHQLVGAHVSIPALQLTTTANFSGEYRFEKLATGRYLVMVQAAGYKGVGDSVTVDASGETYHDFVLLTKAVVLDSVIATAPSIPVRKYISPALNGFEERRASGAGGHFIADDVLRSNDSRKLSDLLLTKTPGMNLLRGPQSAVYVTSGRAPKPSASEFGAIRVAPPPPGLPRACYATVYLDGVLVYDLLLTPTTSPPNIDDFNVDQLAGVEFYAGEAAAPAGFRNSGCGLVLLWTRER